MSAHEASDLFTRLDNWSDRLSPIVVKEVRQMVRGREFTYSFGLSLLVGLLIAFFGGADALAGAGGSGAQVFAWLVGCLALLGFVVSPLGAFNTLRTERSEQTLDLITHTAMSPRRIVIGKLMAQGVKLVTLFAGLAPFIAMSFLLGGIDLTSILIALVFLFMWSLWASAACLFMSCASASRAASGALFAVIAIGFFGLLGQIAPVILPLLGIGPAFPAPVAGTIWWPLAGATAFCFTSMANLVLLAENRLSLPTENRSTALRVGFLVQFLLLITFCVAPSVMRATGYTPAQVVTQLGVMCGLQLALVSIFAVTEDLTLSRRVLRQVQSPTRWRVLAIFRPGGGRGAAWLLLQIGLLLGAAVVFVPLFSEDFLWVLAICSYIVFFTGFPTFLGRRLLPRQFKVSHVRASVFLFLPGVAITAEVLNYFLSSGRVFDTFSAYHLVNPFRSLSNWRVVMNQGWTVPIFVMGVIGLISYLWLIKMGNRESQSDTATH